MLELKFGPKKGVWADDPETLEKLRKNFFGSPASKSKEQRLDIEEALFLVNFQNAVSKDSKGKTIGFNRLASFFAGKEQRLFVKYNAYRDWRDRGLIIKRLENAGAGKAKAKSLKRYPMRPFKEQKLKVRVVWYPDSLFSVMEDDATGKQLFEEFWFGQFGVYKQDRGGMLKMDFLETVFLAKHFGMEVINISGGTASWENILDDVVKKREYARQLYEVYEDWRLRGYVVKSGFKFGSHFRIYFPGASPAKEGKWVHSKHVLHVFPKDQKMLISEWSRAVRVAHGVKKTFILSIPEMKPDDYVEYPADYVAYRRKKVGRDWVREEPETDKPRYLLVPVAEDEHIGGVELASLLKKAQDMGVELLLSITDRETAITYYVLKKVVLPGSNYEYYEIEWMKP